jgi:hypothetical protein
MELVYNEIRHYRNVYEGVSKSFRTGLLERELQMVQLSATRCSCTTILWVSLVSFAAITLCVASQRMLSFVSVYFVIDSIRKLLDTPSCIEYHSPSRSYNRVLKSPMCNGLNKTGRIMHKFHFLESVCKYTIPWIPAATLNVTPYKNWPVQGPQVGNSARRRDVAALCGLLKMVIRS